MSDNDPSWPDEGAGTPPSGGGSTPPGGGTPPNAGGGGATPPPPPGGGGPTGGGGGPTGGGAMSGGGGTGVTAGRTHASFGERAIALLIDFVIFFAVAIVLSIIGFVLGSISDVLGVLYTLLTWVIYIGLGFAIFALGEGGPLGQTPGKHMRGIQVIKEDGSQLGMSGGVIRWLGRILDTIVCGLPIGYLWPLFDDEDRCWHDMVASTRVVTGGPQGGPQEWLAKFRG